MSSFKKVAGTLLGGFGFGQIIGKLFAAKNNQAPAPAPLPVAPSVVSAEEGARRDLERRRRVSFLNGGDTNKTAGMIGATVGTKTLVGQ